MQNPYGQPPPGGYGGYGAPPPPQGPPGYGMPPPGPGGYPMAPMGPTTHPCAIISLIAGIVFCVPGAFLAAIICGFIARGAINREPQRYGGAGLALAGIILGFVHVALWILYAVLWMGIFAAAAASH